MARAVGFRAMPAYEYTTAAISHGLMGRKSEEIDGRRWRCFLSGALHFAGLKIQ